MTDPAKPPTALQKFRRTYPRVDYFPDVLAHAASEKMRQAHPGKSTREAIDALVCAGAKALFPERGTRLSGNADVMVTAAVTSPREVLAVNVDSGELHRTACGINSNWRNQ